ncbi:hypothetical protein [Arthrobacter sp. efr-133-TYG-118]|uniref:hypothetical protein n=1 Tax=Arthrobacter sp. efr-133-TYG-118 TaxID=3040279 RepID=UPI00254E7530|nr:hypothetical protein [Arthrobacter sp. efr-133-TYG-118]
MKHSMCTLAAAAVLGLALAGCQPTAGPITLGSPGATPSPSPSELAAIVQAAVEDRNGTVLDTPPAMRLAGVHMTAAYLSKRERDLPKVARSKAGFKAMGFWYTSFSTKITVESVEVTGSRASVRFKELTEEYQYSTANGPSSVPSGYSLVQTATFRSSGDAWQLDSITPSVPGDGLPMSVVEG